MQLYWKGEVIKDGEMKYLTSSELRTPLPMYASFGCKYLKNVFLITVSLFTLIPNYSSIALMLVCYFYSPPSLIIMIMRPPSSTYFLISWISVALNGSLGPPNINKSASFSFLRVRSYLLISHYK
jgi:hypothetical protein